MGSPAQRQAIATILAVALGAIAGHVVSSAWMVSGLLLLLCSAALPLAVCLFTPRSKVLAALLSTVAMNLTVLIENAVHYSRIDRLDILRESTAAWGWLMVIAVSITLLVSLPLAFWGGNDRSRGEGSPPD